MPTLRRLHLCLGCFFAPLLIFFAVSGLWQMDASRHPAPAGRSITLPLLSSIHTGRSLKLGAATTLSSSATRVLVIAMAVSLVANIVLGLVMAFRSAHRRTASWCLFAGAALPLLFAALALRHAARILPDL